MWLQSKLIIKTYIKDRYLENLPWNGRQVNVTRPQWWLLNIESGIGLVPSSIKPLLETMLTEFYEAMQFH